LFYQKSKIAGCLEQGEILQGVYEHRVWYPSCEPPNEGVKAEIHPIAYPYTIVINPACDLEQDFNQARFPGESPHISPILDYYDDEKPLWIPHIILLQASDKEKDIQARIAQPELWNQVKKNEHKRYHRFEKSTIEGEKTELAALYIDFKKPIALPTTNIYEGIRVGKIQRLAVIPPPYIFDLVQRFSYFFSRIWLP
jgi:hypothetical protein